MSSLIEHIIDKNTAAYDDLASGALLLLDKPYTWTSFHAVKKIRYTTKVKKVGHAGTLDPLASGLLLVCMGKYTKKINTLQGLDKSYAGVMLLGKTTPSIDLETEFDRIASIDHIKEEQIHDQVHAFMGEQQQVPPLHSALKVNGMRLYKKARKNEDFTPEPRLVHIHEFIIEKIDGEKVYFQVTCSKGTYVRSLVRDFGEKLGVGACLASLRRTTIGDFQVDDALTMEEFVEQNAVRT